MSGVSRKQFGDAFSNASIDLGDEGLGAALAGASLDARKLDALDGKVDGRVRGQQAIDDLYDQIDRLDRQTSGLSSERERGLWGALRKAAVAPAPISPAQGEALASAARKLVAEDHPPPGKPSGWALDGAARCENPALSSKTYAGPRAWKCNVFVGEAFYRAGLPFPLNGRDHYAMANRLPSQERFFQPLAKLDDIRAGDLIAIQRKGESGHVEIVTGVERDARGGLVSVSSAGAHEHGPAEQDDLAVPLVVMTASNHGAASVEFGGALYRVLRPMAPPSGPGARGGGR